MKTYGSAGQALEFTAPAGGVVSGRGYQIGSLVVVAEVTAAEGAKFVGQIKGVIGVPKVPAEVWTPALKIYFDASENVFTLDPDTATNPLVGVAAGPIVAASVAVEMIDGEGSDGASVDGLTITIDDYSELESATARVTVGGVVYELVEEDSGEWDALSSNNATATSLASALDAIPGIAAAAVNAVITITPGTGIDARQPGVGGVRLDGVAR